MLFRKGKDAPAKGRRIRKRRLLALLLVLWLLGTAAFFFGLITGIATGIPSLDPTRVQAGEVNGYIYADDGKTILAVLRGSEARVLVDWPEISPWIKHAIVDVEDKRFYEHRGVDTRGIIRALWADVRQKSAVQGGSTITQQFVKNSLVHSQRTIARKLKEAALAWQLEHSWTKARILTAYLNTIYFGNGAYGIQTAAQTYFGHGASKLTLPEAALLAGIPEDPSRWDPVVNPRAARLRREIVLRAMLDQDHITAGDFAKANAAPLPKPQDVHLPGTQNGKAPYFTNYVKQLLVDRYGTGRVFGDGFRVRTSINLTLQQDARNAISKWLTDKAGPSAALVAMDPRDGRVLAMIGGNNYRQSQFNLAVQGERQPGSSFKPFVLATALEEGIAPASQLVSKPVTLYAGGTFWPVHNYEGTYLGPIDLTTATIHSDNTVYAQLTRLVGPANIAKTAHKLGIASPLKSYFSIGLGAQAVNPLEMARAFSAFANGGFRIDGSITHDHPRAIVAIGDKNSTYVACRRPHVVCNSAQPTRVLKPETAPMINSILEGVVNQGTGTHAALPGRPVAGKTGTTENYGDAWFVGYTPQLVTAVWVGYPNKLVPMTSQYQGGPVAGGTFPALIWKAFMEKALKHIPGGNQVEYFKQPSSMYGTSEHVVWRDGKLEVDNGYCNDVASLQFFSGHVPTKRANCKPNEVEVPSLVGKTLTFARLRLAAQPLTPKYVYKPAQPKQRLDIVIAQYPSHGRLSSYDDVTLVVPRATHGVVPDVVGLDLRHARQKLQGRRLTGVVVRFADGRAGHVVSQAPPAGVAAAPHMQVKLVVARG
ncbi:MAG: penicillin-binding protein [Candidatus Eremiobacteraeota bacterium]|nr:penicillin-binding protein [Candidatus Eremiobacteraeota bacterium]